MVLLMDVNRPAGADAAVLSKSKTILEADFFSVVLILKSLKWSEKSVHIVR